MARGKFVGGKDVHLGFVGVEGFGVEVGNLPGSLALGKGGENYLVAAPLQLLLPHVAHVGDVLDVDDLSAPFGKGASYPVGHEVGAQVAHVGVAVNGGAASVDAGYARLDGGYCFHPLVEGVVYAKQRNPPCDTLEL